RRHPHLCRVPAGHHPDPAAGDLPEPGDRHRDGPRTRPAAHRGGGPPHGRLGRDLPTMGGRPWLTTDPPPPCTAGSRAATWSSTWPSRPVAAWPWSAPT